jgi:hypothetical protein
MCSQAEYAPMRAQQKFTRLKASVVAAICRGVPQFMPRITGARITPPLVPVLQETKPMMAPVVKTATKAG